MVREASTLAAFSPEWRAKFADLASKH